MVVVFFAGSAVTVAGMVIAVPLGRAVTTNTEPAGMLAGAVNETLAVPAVTGVGDPTGVEEVPCFSTTSTVALAGLPSDVRSSLFSVNDTAWPALIDAGMPVPNDLVTREARLERRRRWLPRYSNHPRGRPARCRCIVPCLKARKLSPPVARNENVPIV